MFITTAGDEALRKMERAGVLSASEIKSLTKIADGEDSTSHINIKKSTMTKLLRRILSEIGWVSTIGQMCQQLETKMDSYDKRTELLRARVGKRNRYRMPPHWRALGVKQTCLHLESKMSGVRQQPRKVIKVKVKHAYSLEEASVGTDHRVPIQRANANSFIHYHVQHIICLDTKRNMDASVKSAA